MNKIKLNCELPLYTNNTVHLFDSDIASNVTNCAKNIVREMEILNEENNQVNLDNVNISSTQSEANSKYAELREDYNANIDLTTLLRDKIK